jgi:hypothetical protein
MRASVRKCAGARNIAGLPYKSQRLTATVMEEEEEEEEEVSDELLPEASGARGGA